MACVYQPPEWSTAPQPGLWRLSVMKGGVELEKRALDAAITIVGKQAGVCDIVLDHASISRQHAALQFGEGGELYLCDLGSSNGTRVNKEAATPRAYVAVPVGSVIQFGASTRLFVVEGPDAHLPPEVLTPELAALRVRSEVRQLRKAAEKADGRAAAAAAASAAAAGASWGLHEELSEALALARAAETDDSGDRAAGRIPWLEALDLTRLTENEHTLHDRLQKRLLKVRNLGAEARRLTSKAGGTDGLSAGQAAQLAKDEAAVEALLPLIEEDEEALRARLIARGIVNEPAGGLGRGISAHESKFDDDEDVADTTAHHRPPKQAAGAAPVLKLRVVKAGRDAAADASAAPRRINAASLNPRVIQASTPAPSPAAAVAAGAAVPATETLASLQEQLVRARARLLELDSEDQSSADAVQNSAAAAATATAGGDELDSYMAATAAAVHDREAAARLAERRSLEAQVNRIDDLLAAVANAAGADVVEAAAAAAAPTLSEPTAAALPAGSKRKRDAAPEDAADSPASSAPTSATSSATASVERRTGPPPPRMAATGVAAALRTVMQLSEADADAPAATVGRREACSGARGAAASAVSSDGGAHSSLPRAKGAGGASSFDCDEPEVKWAPPVGQTGDGRTSLNDKLGY